MSKRTKTCTHCGHEFYSGHKGVISPINHSWFCTKAHYEVWWKDQQWKRTLEKVSDNPSI